MPASKALRYRPETRLVHAGQIRSELGETSETLFLTQGFVYDTAEECAARFKGEEPGFVYARFSNPTVAMFEQRMAAFEGAEAARATASGRAAVTAAMMGQLRAGDHVVAAKALFGSCRWVIEELLPRFGVASTLVDGLDLDQWRQAVRANTKSFFLESPTNPTLEIIDIAAVAEIAHAAGATLVVDNVFATPLWQSPLALGADCVVYSATKHIDGQGRCLGGVILASEAFIQQHMNMLLDELLRRQDDAAETAALAVDVLGRRIDHAVGAERERALPDRRREHVVDDQPRAAAMRDLGDAADVEHVERRVGRAFQEAAFRVRPHRLAPLVEIEAIDQRGGNAVARQQVFHYIAARSEQRLRGNHVIAGLERRQNRRRHRGHAGCGGARGFGALEFDHAPLEHRDVGIRKARIEKAGLVALEPRLALLGGVVDKALGQKQRLGRFAELRAQRAGMDQPGFGTVAGG
jgi:hypothetical protein